MTSVLFPEEGLRTPSAEVTTPVFACEPHVGLQYVLERASSLPFLPEGQMHGPHKFEEYSFRNEKRKRLDGKPALAHTHPTELNAPLPQGLRLVRSATGLLITRVTTLRDTEMADNAHLNVKTKDKRFVSQNRSNRSKRPSDAKSGSLLGFLPEKSKVVYRRTLEKSSGERARKRAQSTFARNDYCFSAYLTPAATADSAARGDSQFNEVASGGETAGGATSTMAKGPDVACKPVTTRRIIHQYEIIRPGMTFAAPRRGAATKSTTHRGRLLLPSDALWSYDRQQRLAQIQLGDPFLSSGMASVESPVPRLLTEPPALPQVLEAGLVDHYLASLMMCPPGEAERIVSTFVPHEWKDLLSYLRRAYGYRPLSLTVPPICKKQMQSLGEKQRDEFLQSDVVFRRRRNSSNNIWPFGSHSAVAGEFAGLSLMPPKHLRTFLKHFAGEVCMAFMDEACAMCRARNERVLMSLPEGARERGTFLSDEAVTYHCEQEVTQLLGQLLSWSEKEYARVVPLVVQLVKQYLSVPQHKIQSPVR
ncbi:hypothetical protein ERJ75_000059000 [Trypanosoma vivax]|uniref:Uncharacterized protein n=1 Tax=Trypanosoma vivax (strain Y486) TaxID=1055687 RepID=G0TZ23_TRYVY|nr:hypothetical protein ERJ75_000059000 [Trypanosoma vivax]CCC49226.1 conserved hypothetical protein [Trypanosoma vivax Y486]